jgi:hypothetical protein
VSRRFLPLLLMLWAACREPSQQAAPPAAAPAHALEVQAVPGGYGYTLLRDGKPLIRQPFVPAVPGRMPFPDSLTARRAGELALRKLDAGEFPPALSREELQALWPAGQPLPGSGPP